MEWEDLARELSQTTETKIVLLVMDGVGGLDLLNIFLPPYVNDYKVEIKRKLIFFILLPDFIFSRKVWVIDEYSGGTQVLIALFEPYGNNLQLFF